MELLEQRQSPVVVPIDERAARKTLRAQIARLERELAETACAAYPRIPMTSTVAGCAGPRLLDLGELEVLRDDLAERLKELKTGVDRQTDLQAAKRLLIEDMLLEPARYKWVRVSNADIGEHGCKSWHVRPRLGLIGMLAGWWHVKISSGCPLAGGRRPRSTHG